MICCFNDYYFVLRGVTICCSKNGDGRVKGHGAMVGDRVTVKRKLHSVKYYHRKKLKDDTTLSIASKCQVRVSFSRYKAV